MKKTKRFLRFAWVAFTIILLLAASSWVRTKRCRLREHYCQSYLNGLRFLAVIYKEEHAGKWPRTFQDIADARLVDSPSDFMCRGSGRQPGSMTNIASWSDYECAAGTNAGEDFFLVYDRSLLNHERRGVNVLYVRGGCTSLTDVIFWDPEARWLCDFAEKHKGLNLILPRAVRRR